MEAERILILLDGETVVSAFVVSITIAAQIEERVQLLKRCPEHRLPPFKLIGGLDERVQGLKGYAEENGFQLIEVQAPVYRSLGELGWVDSTILAAILKRTVDCAPRDLDGLRKLSRDEKWMLASGLHDLHGQAQGGALFTEPFEDLEDDEMAERLYHRLVEHDARCRRVVDVENESAVSFSALVEKYCHPTAMNDAVRVLNSGTTPSAGP